MAEQIFGRRLALVSGGFAVGVFLGVYLIDHPWTVLAAAVLTALGGICLIPRVGRLLKSMPLYLVLFAMAAGFFRWYVSDITYYRPARELCGQSVTVRCVVSDYPTQWQYGKSVDAEITDGGLKCRLYYYDGGFELHPGDEIEITAQFRLTDEPATTLMGYAGSNVTVIGHRDGLRFAPVRVAHRMAETVESVFPDDVSGFLKAIILGDRADINDDPTLRSAFSSAGVSHIIAVSGLHVAFLTGFIYLLFGKRRWTAALILPLTLFFMAVTGFTPSVVRAGIMQAFILLAPIFKRENDSVTALFAALLIILTVDPSSAANIGLQLSFSATFGIILISHRMASSLTLAAGITRKADRTQLRKTRDGLLRFLIVSLSVTVGALLFTTPLTALYFGKVSVVAPITNLLIVWIASFIFSGGLIVTAIGLVSVKFASLIAFPVTVAVRYVLTVVKLIGSLPFAAVSTSNRLVIWWLVYVYLVALTLILFKNRLKYALMAVSAPSAMLCCLLLVSAVSIDRAAMTVTALDVGEGQCIVITVGGFTAAVDCGSQSEYLDPGNRLAEYIFSLGRSKIDALVLTHYDSDHTCGVDELMNRLDVGVILMPEPTIFGGETAKSITEIAEKRGTEIVYVTGDTALTLPDGEMKVFPPLVTGGSNDMCLSCLVSRGDNDILITGDMPAEAERVLVIEKSLPDVEVMVAGHHGAATSTGTTILDAVRPEAVIISCGTNDYGHPAQETMERINGAGAAVYRTDIMGNVTITFK